MRVSRGEFEVHFQPIVDVLTNRVVCAESLLRWRDPVRGLLLPSDFLSLAEETGLIVPIGEWVLREACRAVVDWRARSSGYSPRPTEPWVDCVRSPICSR